MSEVERRKTAKVDGVVVGFVTSLDATGAPLVAYACNDEDLPVVAKSTMAIDSDAIGREVALLFENGDVRKPVIMGLMHTASAKSMLPPVEELEVRMDDEWLQLEAQERIVLKCGKSSITLTRAGKVIIRGTYISTISSGANRIRGGSVQIN